MKKTWDLIVVPCYTGNDGQWWIDSVSAISMKIHEEKEGISPDSAYNQTSLLRRAEAFCKPGLAVIVRPNFNDLHEHGELVGFREWRSFDGGPLNEVKFRGPVLKG